MHKYLLALAFVIASGLLAPLQAAELGGISALRQPAWLQRETDRTPLADGQAIVPGDRLITGAEGRVELRLGSVVSLLLNADSEIRIDAADGGLYLHRGSACLSFNPASAEQDIFRLDIGGMLTASMRHEGRFCAAREQRLSSVGLRDGSVQLKHTVDQSMIVLSETGSEFRIDDDGEFSLLLDGIDETLTEFDESPVVPEPAPSATDSLPAPALDDTEAAPATDDIEQAATSVYVYTVYLFSTRSEEIARQVNQQFHDAGHATQIIVNEDDSETRYRVAMSGFDDRESAQAFASAFSGEFDIGNAWIGRQKRGVE